MLFYRVEGWGAPGTGTDRIATEGIPASSSGHLSALTSARLDRWGFMQLPQQYFRRSVIRPHHKSALMGVQFHGF
jgi:hypothetical protein